MSATISWSLKPILCSNRLRHQARQCVRPTHCRASYWWCERAMQRRKVALVRAPRTHTRTGQRWRGRARRPGRRRAAARRAQCPCRPPRRCGPGATAPPALPHAIRSKRTWRAPQEKTAAMRSPCLDGAGRSGSGPPERWQLPGPLLVPPVPLPSLLHRHRTRRPASPPLLPPPPTHPPTHQSAPTSQLLNGGGAGQHPHPRPFPFHPLPHPPQWAPTPSGTHLPAPQWRWRRPASTGRRTRSRGAAP